VLANQHAEVSHAPQGKRNPQLYDAALKCGSFVAGAGMSEADVIRTLYDAANANGLVAEDGAGKVRDTIRSGLENGKANPRGVPEPPPVTVVQPAKAADTNAEQTDDGPHRQLTLTPASSIRVRPIHWLWHQRIAVGTLALLGGREGLGKSTVAYGLVADVTRGRLAGAHHGQPRGVIIAATEDSWEHTIVPRLMAADADLDRVFRVDVTTVAGVHTSLSLPRDLPAMKRAVDEADAAMILLDPLMSRLDAKLDSHKDADVRLALEPLTELADTCRVAMLGIIHVNKSTQADPVNLLMGSRAFGAVARAVLFVMRDPDDDNLRLLGQPKNNLGGTDLPTLTFTIDGKHVADTDDGPVTASYIIWNGERQQSINDALEAASEDYDSRSATAEAADWLMDHLTSQGGCDESAMCKQKGRRVGHSEAALTRARKRLRVVVETVPGSYPRRTTWALRESLPTVVSKPWGE
jgi:hypothetical protein